MRSQRSVASVTATLEDLNRTGHVAGREDLEQMILAMIELVARSTTDVDAELAEILR